MFFNTHDKLQCCGCKACAGICPQKCISFKQDEEHFLYPEIDYAKCKNCKACEKVCPIENKPICLKKDVEVWVGKYKSEEVLFNSSSGGAFTAIYKTLLNKGYVIFGVRWTKEHKVIHDVATNEKECEAFRKSKYILSDSNHSFNKVRKILSKGGKVCFTGTPCQCAALLNFLKLMQIKCENLIIIDIICHGAPNQYLFDKYISEKITTPSNYYQFEFKNKIPVQGEINSRTATLTDIKGNIDVFTKDNDPFLKGYYGRLFYRPYCAKCAFASRERVSDITIGDAWNIEKVYSDWKSLEGISLMLINSPKGKVLFNEIQKNDVMLLRKMDIDWAVKNNTQLREPTKMHPKRKKFFELLKHNTFEDSVNFSMKIPLYRKILQKIKHIMFKW